MNYRKSVVLKKALRYTSNIWRPFYGGSSGVIANSVPKSGTHLLTLIWMFLFIQPVTKMRQSHWLSTKLYRREFLSSPTTKVISKIK